MSESPINKRQLELTEALTTGIWSAKPLRDPNHVSPAAQIERQAALGLLKPMVEGDPSLLEDIEEYLLELGDSDVTEDTGYQKLVAKLEQYGAEDPMTLASYIGRENINGEALGIADSLGEAKETLTSKEKTDRYFNTQCDLRREKQPSNFGKKDSPKKQKVEGSETADSLKKAKVVGREPNQPYSTSQGRAAGFPHGRGSGKPFPADLNIAKRVARTPKPDHPDDHERHKIEKEWAKHILDRHKSYGSGGPKKQEAKETTYGQGMDADKDTIAKRHQELSGYSLTALQGVARKMGIEKHSNKEDQVSTIMGHHHGHDWEDRAYPSPSKNESFTPRDHGTHLTESMSKRLGK